MKARLQGRGFSPGSPRRSPPRSPVLGRGGSPPRSPRPGRGSPCSRPVSALRARASTNRQVSHCCFYRSFPHVMGIWPSSVSSQSRVHADRSHPDILHVVYRYVEQCPPAAGLGLDPCSSKKHKSGWPGVPTVCFAHPRWCCQCLLHTGAVVSVISHILVLSCQWLLAHCGLAVGLVMTSQQSPCHDPSTCTCSPSQ